MLRRRRVALAVTMLFAGVPPLLGLAGPADAGPATPSGTPDGAPEVVFTGPDLFGVRCGSVAGTRVARLPAESTLTVVNRLGRRARLTLDGVARGDLLDGSSARVLFHRGPVALALKPLCAFSTDVPVRVDVLPVGRVVPWASGDGAAVDPAVHRPGVPAAEPVSPLRPVGGGGPVGLLALVATVCVGGVSAGAFRAIIAQRATRAIIA